MIVLAECGDVSVPCVQVYRKELEEDGVVVDPLRASYCAPVRHLAHSVSP